MKQSTFSAVMATNLLNVLQEYTKGIRFVAVLLVLFTVNIGTARAEKSIDFESGTATYSDWTFTNMTSQQSGSITAKGGSYYGTTGGKATASIQTKNQISSPKSISCYVSKQSNNTSSSTWYIQTSTNGSSWTNVKTQSATSMSKGTWVEFTADLSSYSNVYVRIYYSGSTAVRNIDNLVLTEGTTTSYDVNWKVNGETYTTGSPTTSVPEGSKVTILPTAPSLDCSGKTFVGWSNEEVTDGSEPDVLFTTAENSPAITEPTTFHAVFATKGSNQTATFDAATISGLTKSSSSLTWTHNTSGIELYLSAGQRYTSGTPNTFTVTSGTSNYCQLSAPTGINMSKVIATLSGTNYKINSVSTPWTLSTSSTTQTISSTNGSDYLKMSATSDYQIRITQLVVTYATYSDYTTSCTTETVVTLHPNGGTPSVTEEHATEGTSFTLPECPFTRTGYTFANWNTKENGTGTSYNDKAIINNLDGTPINLYAQWECDIPEFTLTSTTFARTEGQEIRIASNATNVPANAKFTWYLNGAEVANQSSSELYIASCTIADAGNYTCTISYDDCSFNSTNNYSVKIYSVRGLKEDWNTLHPFTSTSETEGEFSIYLDANTSFKVWDGEYYYGNPESGTMSGTSENWTMQQNVGGDVTLTNIIAGTYTFKLDYSDASNTKISVYYPSKITVYLNPMSGDAGPYYAIHTWNGSNTEDLFMEKVDDCDPYRNIYKAEINASHKNLIFVSTKASTVADMWNQKNYQTIDLTYPTDNDKMLFDMSKLYLTPNSNWKQADARFAAYFFGNGDTWASMNKVEGETNLYEVAIPTNKDYPNVIFCRMNPSTTANNWDNKWNQSSDLTITKDKNHYTITEGQDNWSSGTWSTDGYWTTYTPNYTVSFDANGHGTAPEDQCITDGGKATLPTPAPTATGYTFAGWYKDADCTNAWDFANDVVTEDIILYAKWTVNTHTVTWKPAGGNWDGDASDIVQEYEYGAVIEAPEKPTYDCYEFVEWTPTYNAEMTMPDEDLVFTATWNKLSYTITFKNYDGTVLQTSTVECDETPSYTGAMPTREQTAQYTYTFKGWSPIIAPATQDQVYTAQFDEVTRLYTVTWMVGTTEYTAGTPTDQVEYDKKVTNLPTSPQDDAIGTCANKFMGWSTKSSGSNAENADYYDDLFTTAENSPAITDATTFYAVFATKEGSSETTQMYKLVTNISGGKEYIFATGNSAGSVNGLTCDANSNLTATALTVITSNGITYIETPTSNNVVWNITGSSSSYNAQNKGQSGKYLRCYGTSPNAVIAASAYALYWSNSKGLYGKSNSGTTSYYLYYNTSTSKWGAASSASGRVYAFEKSEVTVDNTTYSNYVTNCCALARATNLTVSGTTANSATLTWTAPSPTTGITKLQVRDENGNVKVDNLAADATTATITGLSECTEYTFCIASVGDCEVVSDIVTATPFSGAKTVNYDYTGGTGSPASFTTNCTNQTITLPVATRTGWTFNGWYTAATGGTRVGDANETYEPATSPVTLYAQWTINKYTVTWNPNGGNWNGSTSNIVQTYEYGAAINKPEDPTRENGIFKRWSPEPTSTMLASNKIYTAQWEMVYTLTFVDMNAGGTTTTLTQTSSGQNLVAPTANSEVCDMWTFIGWAPSNSLNGGTDKPTGFIAAGETIPGSQITGNKTYYSVYSYNSDNTQEFEIGKSGTYLMYAISGTTKYYATTARTGGFYGNPETSFATYGPSKFTLTYNKTENKYIIYHENTTSGRESKGYFELNTSNGDVDVKSETPSLFTIQAGSNGAFIIRTDYNTSPRSFGYDGNFTDYSGDNPIYFEPASEIQYYNAANCGEVETYTMSFHNPFGDENALIWYDAEHEDSYYTDKPLNTLIDVFPTMVYNGWAFIGWTAQQYNELIGDENLDDENSATNDPASSLTIYSNTAGWSYQLKSNVTMYPVFTKYEDNEDIDLGSGGEYYMYFYREDDYYKDDYFGSDNHYQRMYALAGGGDNGEFGYTTNCNNAQIFEFIKEGDGWNIRVKNADGTYPTKSYLVNTSGNDYDLVAAKPSSKWSITKEPEGDYTMWYKGNNINQTTPGYYVAKAREYSGGTSWTFKCYNQDNDASQYYYKVYLGTCENRVFSSNPTNKPAITLSGEPIVTSTQDQSIRAQGELSISATKLAANGTITLTSDNADVYFSTVKDANFTQATKPLASLTLNADEKGKLATTPVYVHYKPTSTSNLGVQIANITATTGTNGQPDYATATTTAALRNLPTKFVIATKVGAIWYALPADLTTASNPLGVVIEVDENNMTATAPNSCTYTLFPVKTTNTEYDRYEEYGDRLRFSAVNNSYKGLWANNSKTDLTINNDMVIDQASDGQTGSDLANNSYYEWKVTTTVVDGHWQYTLQTDQTQNQNYLRYWTSAEGTPVGPKWGTYNAGENKLYFLPVTETQPFEYAVVEWYPTKMLIQTDAAITSPTVKVRGEEVATPVLTSKGGKLYEISNLPLETNPNEVLQVSFTADAVNYVNAKVVPIILSRGEKSITGEPFPTLTQKVYQYADVVVRDGATLTIDGGTDVANTLLSVTIYPTAKVSIAEGKKLSVHNLTFFGGIDEIYDGSAYTINKYGVPQLSLKGILNKTVTNMDYIMRVNLDQMYQVGVPYDVNLSDITYWDGTTMTLGDNLYVSAYDGQKRANREDKSWVWETDFTEKVLKAGIGYTISADKQYAAHEYSIIRMPMKNNITSGNTETAKTVQVYAYDNTKGVEITDNHKGWNYLSNPYMVAISGAEADSKLVVGYLRETGTGPWEWVDDTYRYVTIPSDDGKWYDQQKFDEATLLPFKSFFLQIARDGELSFALASRQNAPARYLQNNNEQREVEFEVLLANDTRSDNLGFLIGEDYTPAYEINADLEKMIGSMSVYTIYNGYNLAYNALSPANAEEQIPIGYVVPTVGEYTFALDESSDIEDVEHIYLIDYETSAITDLVTDIYTFTALEQKSDTRFAINVALKSKDNAATGLDNMNTNGELPTKFIYQDKIFILHHGVIYDATGKRVITINK